MKFLLCCCPLTYQGTFKAVAYTDLLLNIGLIVAGAYAIKQEFSVNTLFYMVLTVLYILLVIWSLRKFYEDHRLNAKFQHFYAILRLLILIVSLLASYSTYMTAYYLLDNYDGPKKTICWIYFGAFTATLFIYFLLNISWSIKLLKVTYGQRSGDEEQDSEELLD